MFTHQRLPLEAIRRATISSFAALGAFLLTTASVNAQSVTIRRLTTRPRLEGFAGAEHPTAVDALTPIDRLVQRSPVDGAPITERTVVYLGFDAQNLYAVFVCWYSPGALRAHRVNRDRLPDDDDSVALHLDTFHDRRHLYGFQVNPAGVQVDGVFTEGQGWDLSFDTVWDAQTLIRPDRFIVMITVPFSSIRFPEAAEQDWGFFVYRGMPRKNEERSGLRTRRDTWADWRMPRSCEDSSGSMPAIRLRLFPTPHSAGRIRARRTAHRPVSSTAAEGSMSRRSCEAALSWI